MGSDRSIRDVNTSWPRTQIALGILDVTRRSLCTCHCYLLIARLHMYTEFSNTLSQLGNWICTHSLLYQGLPFTWTEYIELVESHNVVQHASCTYIWRVKYSSLTLLPTWLLLLFIHTYGVPRLAYYRVLSDLSRYWYLVFMLYSALHAISIRTLHHYIYMIYYSY